MERRDFYQTLEQLPMSYSWHNEGNTICATKTRGIGKGSTFNPVTAVAHNRGKGTYRNNKRDTLRAGKALGLPSTFTVSLYDATKAASNRGNAQVVRGRLRAALDV